MFQHQIRRLLHSFPYHLQQIKSHSSIANIFDRNAKYLQRERSAMLPNHNDYDYIREEMGYETADRLNDIAREFKIALDLGCGKGFLSKNLHWTNLEELHMAEFSDSLLAMAEEPEGISVTKTVIDEEKPLPFDTNSFDVILSSLNLHWVNNLPLCLKEVHRVLRPDCPFLCSMFSGETLYQLRSAFVLAEQEREGGVSPHVSPFVGPQDVSGLLSNAGFVLVSIDTNEFTIHYPTMFELMTHLRGMGENNASMHRKLRINKDTIFAAAAIYKEMFGNEEGKIPATFQMINMIGWKPDPLNVPKVSARGSGKISMKDLGNLSEIMKGVKKDD